MSDLWESVRDYRRLKIRGKTAENPHRKHSMTSHRRLPPTRFPSLSLLLPAMFFSLSLRIQSVWDGGKRLNENEGESEWHGIRPPFFSSPDIYPSLCISVILLKATLSLFPSFLCNRLSPSCYYAYFSPAFPLPKPFYFYSLFITSVSFTLSCKMFLAYILFSGVQGMVQYFQTTPNVNTAYINNVHNHS